MMGSSIRLLMIDLGDQTDVLRAQLIPVKGDGDSWYDVLHYVLGIYHVANEREQTMEAFASKASLPSRDLTDGVNYQREETLDSGYKVHKSSSFKLGRVFRVLWSEPAELYAQRDALVPKIRRFLTLDQSSWRWTCLRPIMTNMGQRDNKSSAQNLMYNGTDDSGPKSGSWDVRDHSKTQRTDCEKDYCRKLRAILVDELESDLGGFEELLVNGEGTEEWFLANLENYRHYEQLRTSYPSAAMGKAIAASNTISGSAMGGSFMWLNARMDLQCSGWLTGWITEQAAELIPLPLAMIFREASDGAVLMVFAACTAIFVGTTYVWLKSKARKWPAIFFALMCSIGLIIGGMNAQGFALVGLPLSIGFGVLCGSIYTQHKRNIYQR